MIFVTLGTHEQPFERALDLVTPLAKRHDVIVQHGHTPRRPSGPSVLWLGFAEYDEVVNLMDAACGVVCHAGTGTIMTALWLGKTPVVVPRLHRYGEHVDDHQLQIARAFADRGLVVVCEDGDALEPALRAARRPAARRPQQNGLRRAVALAAAGDGR